MQMLDTLGQPCPLGGAPAASCSTTLYHYVREGLPQLAKVASIVSALKKHGRYTEKELQEALAWGKGPLLKDGASYRGRLWDLEVNTADNSITINFPLRENYSDFRAKWDRAKTRDEREELVQKWKETKENIQHRAYTFDTPIFEYVFFTNKAGKKIWAIGAVLLDGLVRLGVRKKMTKEEDDTDPYLHDLATSSDQAFGAKQSTLFQIEVYGKAVVDEARVKLDKVYDTIRTTTPRNSPWRNAP